MSSPSSPRFCDNCGVALRPQARFCSSCGREQLSYASATATGALVSNALLKQRYRIERLLGQGGFGAVYQAEDTLFKNARRAIKEMSQSELRSPQERAEAITAFEQEATLLIGLVHPHLPRIYDYFEEVGRWYLVMDFIDGETLEARLGHTAGGKLLLEETLDIGIKLCSVLHYLHTRQPPIIFRDLKPANVMLTPENDLYLIDFGIARLFKPGQSKDTIAFGSPGYAAPEQYGKAQTTPQSDIYSLGATLHQLLSGVDPSTNQPLLWDFTPLDAAVPASLAQLITHMVHIRMDERPASLAVIRQELQRIAGQQSAGSGALAPTTQPQPAGAAASPQKTKEQWFDEGDAHNDAGRYAEALAAYSQALQLDPTDDAAWNNKGIALNHLKRYEEALAAYDRSLQLDPHDALVWYNKGMAFNHLKRYQEALAAYNHAIQLNPNDADAWNGKGWVLRGLKRYQGALAAFGCALQLTSDDADTRSGKGWVFIDLKRYEDALDACEQAIQLDPTNASAWSGKGWALGELDRPQESLAACEQAIQLDPTNASAWTTKGAALIELRRYQEALKACERAIQLDPTYASAWNNKGVALEALRRTKEAEQAFKKARELDRQG